MSPSAVGMVCVGTFDSNVSFCSSVIRNRVWKFKNCQNVTTVRASAESSPDGGTYKQEKAVSDGIPQQMRSWAFSSPMTFNLPSIEQFFVLPTLRILPSIPETGMEGISPSRKNNGFSETQAMIMAASLTPSSLFTSLLVAYSVLISDWWKFKYSAGDKFKEWTKEYPPMQKVTTLAAPTLHKIGQLSLAMISVFYSFFSIRPNLLLERITGARRLLGLEDSKVVEEEELINRPVQDSEETVNRPSLWRGDDDQERKEPIQPQELLGFSFSAAGLLFPYHLGVTQCLIDNGFITDKTRLAGSSAGAIVCAVIACGLGMDAALDATKDLAKDCRLNGTAFRLGFVLRKFLDEFLPEDAHVQSSGRIRVAVTQVFRSPRALLIDSFDSREDLINSLITSSYVPGYLAPTPMTRFRGRYCVDGGISQFMPPTACKETVRICAFPASSLGLKEIGISPDLNPVGRASMKELFTWALEPAEDDTLDALFEQGYKDALAWVDLQKNDLVPAIISNTNSY